MNTVAVSLLSQAGLPGIEAEAALRSALAALAGPSDAALAAIEGVGLAASDIDPTNHRIATIVRRLADAGLDEDTAQTIFGDRGAPAMLVLVERVDQLERLQKPSSRQTPPVG